MKKLIYVVFVVAASMVSCGGNVSELLIDSVRFNGPDEIRLQVGESIMLSVDAPSKLDAEYTWVYAKNVIGTGKSIDFSQSSPGSGILTVIIRDSDKHLRSFERKVFVTRVTSYKIVGYLPSYRTNLSVVQWDKLTHLNLAFARINADGSLNDTQVRARFAGLSKTARANGVRLVLSLGGGGGQDEQDAFSACLTDKDARTLMVDNVLQTVRDLSLDGVDIDYEGWAWGSSDANVARQKGLLDVVSMFRKALPDGVVSAALSGNALQNGWYSKDIFDQLDYVTLMAYDKTGTWSSEIGPHAPYDYFVQLCETCTEQGIPGEKIVPGVPFYGRAFPYGKTANARDYSYSEIVSAYPGAENKNAVETDYLWYDGLPMIADKCDYVKANSLGGIMIWEITMDSADASKSLLAAINTNFN